MYGLLLFISTIYDLLKLANDFLHLLCIARCSIEPFLI